MMTEVKSKSERSGGDGAADRQIADFGGAMPIAQNRLAKLVLTKRKTIAMFAVENGLDAVTFLSSLVICANELGVKLTDSDTSHPITQASFLRSCLNSAVIGLMPGVGLGHCYLVPFKRKKKAGGFSHYEIQWMAGYRGLMELAFRNNFLSYCSSEVVLAGEEIARGFTERGPWLKHEIPVPREKATMGNIIGAYCTYGVRSGKESVVYVDKHELQAVKGTSDPWKFHPAAMCRKTAVRRASKEWQMARQLAMAVALDEMAEEGRPQQSLTGGDAEAAASGELNLDDLVVEEEEKF